MSCYRLVTSSWSDLRFVEHFLSFCGQTNTCTRRNDISFGALSPTQSSQDGGTPVISLLGRYSREDPILYTGVKSSLQDTPFHWICPLKPSFGSYGSSILIFIKDLPYCFPYGCPNFSLHPCPHFPPLSLDDNHPNRCQVMAHCNFDLGFPDGQGC